MAVLNVEGKQFDTEVVKIEGPVLVDFFAEWCGPCKVVGPIIDEISGSYEGRVKFVKVDIDTAQEIAGKLGVMSVPTLMIFKNGEVAAEKVGAIPKDQLASWIDENI
ncbi:thioredoxin [PVC group bacterium]|nr:thioredoxin [PVC group bacterium]